MCFGETQHVLWGDAACALGRRFQSQKSYKDLFNYHLQRPNSARTLIDMI
jgi:hypothetical protein